LKKIMLIGVLVVLLAVVFSGCSVFDKEVVAGQGQYCGAGCKCVCKDSGEVMPPSGPCKIEEYSINEIPQGNVEMFAGNKINAKVTTSGNCNGKTVKINFNMLNSGRYYDNPMQDGIWIALGTGNTHENNNVAAICAHTETDLPPFETCDTAYYKVWAQIPSGQQTAYNVDLKIKGTVSGATS